MTLRSLESLVFLMRGRRQLWHRNGLTCPLLNCFVFSPAKRCWMLDHQRLWCVFVYKADRRLTIFPLNQRFLQNPNLIETTRFFGYAKRVKELSYAHDVQSGSHRLIEP